MTPTDVQGLIGKLVTVCTNDAEGLDVTGEVVGLTHSTKFPGSKYRRTVPAIRLRDSSTHAHIIPLEDVEHWTQHPRIPRLTEARLPDEYTADEVRQVREALSPTVRSYAKRILNELRDAGITVEFPPERYYVEKDLTDWDVRDRQAEDGKDLVATFWHYFNDAEENARGFAEWLNAAEREA